MNLASVSSTPPVASTCFRCRRAFIFSFSPSPLSLYFPRDSAWPRVRSLRTESDGARIGDTESYGSELLRRPLNSSEEEGSSEEGDDEFVDWEDKILEVTVPLVGFVRMLLHSGKYVQAPLFIEEALSYITLFFNWLNSRFSLLTWILVILKHFLLFVIDLDVKLQKEICECCGVVTAAYIFICLIRFWNQRVEWC